MLENWQKIILGRDEITISKFLLCRPSAQLVWYRTYLPNDLIGLFIMTGNKDNLSGEVCYGKKECFRFISCVK